MPSRGVSCSCVINSRVLQAQHTLHLNPGTSGTGGAGGIVTCPLPVVLFVCPQMIGACTRIYHAASDALPWWWAVLHSAVTRACRSVLLL